MKATFNIFIFIILFACNACSGDEIKNKKTETAKIYGNCSMCQNTIETAGNIKNEATVVWDKETKIAKLTYDSTKTSKDEILYRIAQSGYDNELYRSPDMTYNKLPQCCHYDRPEDVSSIIDTSDEQVEKSLTDTTSTVKNESTTEAKSSDNSKPQQNIDGVLREYFALNSALVASDPKKAAKKAAALVKSIDMINTPQLSSELKTTWKKQSKTIRDNALAISKSEDIKVQRAKYLPLSDALYIVTKSADNEAPVYYQYCPMANDGKGAHWLSAENQVNNPYYGSEMLHCGETVETIN